MKTIKPGVIPALCLGASLVCAGLTGCATTEDAGSPDAMTAENVKQALVSQGGQQFASVRVHVHDGVARLSGTIDTRADRDRAAEIASTVGNVHQTINKLSVASDIRLDNDPFPNPAVPPVGVSE